MVILQESLTDTVPDNNAIVSTTSCKLLAILLVCNAVDCVSVTSDLLDHLATICIINEHSVCNCEKHLESIYITL